MLYTSQLFISKSYVQKNSTYQFFESLDIDEGEKEGEGIYFIVYSRHNQTLARYYSEAVTSAKRIKGLDERVWNFDIREISIRLK